MRTTLPHPSVLKILRFLTLQMRLVAYLPEPLIPFRFQSRTKTQHRLIPVPSLESGSRNWTAEYFRRSRPPFVSALHWDWNQSVHWWIYRAMSLALLSRPNIHETRHQTLEEGARTTEPLQLENLVLDNCSLSLSPAPRLSSYLRHRTLSHIAIAYVHNEALYSSTL